jgi:prepilin peptidase CpaA
MTLIILYQISIALFCAVMLIAAVQDLSDYTIPNSLIIAMATAYPFYVLSTPMDITWGWSLAVAGVFFLIGLGLFSAGIMGGGDVKLITVTALWVGVDGLAPFVIVMSVVGGLMSILMLTTLRQVSAYYCGRMGFISVQEKIMTDQLPYGVAICAGGLYVAYHTFIVA